MRLSIALALLCGAAFAQDWPYYGGDQAGSRYSALDQINRPNVAKLKVAWEWKTGEAPNAEFTTDPGNFEAAPLMIGGVFRQPGAITPISGRSLRSISRRT